MPDIHYSDAILTVIFAGGIGMAIYLFNRHADMNRRLQRIETILFDFFDFNSNLKSFIKEANGGKKHELDNQQT